MGLCLRALLLLLLLLLLDKEDGVGLHIDCMICDNQMAIVTYVLNALFLF